MNSSYQRKVALRAARRAQADSDMAQGLLNGLLPQLDIPLSAKLVGVETRFADDGSQTWTVTFKSQPDRTLEFAPTASPSLPAATVVADSPGVPPKPPLLSDMQLTGGVRTQPPVATTAASTRVPTDDSSQTGAPPTNSPSGFPLLPFQQGAINRLFPLRCMVMTYAWGRRGTESLVGRLAAANDIDFHVEDRSPYAELWMGTHPNGPSMVLIEMPWRTITPLIEWLKLNPDMQGKRGTQVPALGRRRSMINLEYNGLPFLLKVLSVQTALSIQAHPDKELARRLHSSRPDMYKDDNHKPEMALAVTRFEALCSFQKANHILANCHATPELVAVVGEAAVQGLVSATERAAPLTPGRPLSPTSPTSSSSKQHTFPDPASSTDEETRHAIIKPALTTLFTRLMTAEPERVKEQLDVLVRRVRITTPMLRTPVDELAVRLNEQYPGDVGVFCVYLLNYVALEPGQALFLGANEPHAYISGECVECMAASDNVVRAGLTPKLRDVETLTTMLTYIDGPPHIVQGVEIAHNVHRYKPPVDEFLIDRVSLAAGSNATLPSAPGVSIILVLSGSGTLEEFPEEPGASGLLHKVDSGAIFVASADTLLRVTTAKKPIMLFRATARYDEP